MLINFEPQYFLKKYIYFFILNQTVKIFQGNWKKQIKKNVNQFNNTANRFIL